VKWLLFLLGWLSFALGVIGAFLPILPTTPFLILSAYLFSKSSPRFHTWLLDLPWAGGAIKDWEKNRVIRPRAKILCTIMLIISALLIWHYAQVHVGFKVALLGLLTGVGYFVVTRKSI
jgi:uncharacterized protein